MKLTRFTQSSLFGLILASALLLNQQIFNAQDADPQPEQPVATATNNNTDNPATAEPVGAVEPAKSEASEPTLIPPATPDTDGLPPVTPGDLPFPDLNELLSNVSSTAITAQMNMPFAKAEPKKASGWSLGAMMTFGLFIVIVLGSFFAANYLAKQWRLPDHNVRIFILLVASIGSITATYLGWQRMKLGIDLRGGVVLVYDAAPKSSDSNTDQAAGGLTNDIMDGLAKAIKQRVDPSGVLEISVSRLGLKQIQVIIPDAEGAEIDRIRRIIGESGALEFRILASPLYAEDTTIIERGRRLPLSEKQIREDEGRRLIAQWVPVQKSELRTFYRQTDIITRQNKDEFEVLILYNDGVNVKGDDLRGVTRGMDSGRDGRPPRPGVNFVFNASGGSKFKRLTSKNQPDKFQPNLKRNLGIIMNESLYSAPSIDAVIETSGIITFGERDGDEGHKQLNRDINDLIDVLNAGGLPAELSREPVAEQKIGAMLGEDTIQKANLSLLGATAIIFAFMLVYYRLAGFIACFCVVANLAMIISTMLALSATFTLPGLAGLVLTIGMAIDANILIYERLREELQGGASLKMAIRNAYAKALPAILDSNITSIFVGIILYTVGTEQVKGFAVTFILGIAFSMFTAIYCARTIMDILETQRWVKTFAMMQLFKRPHFNFLGARWHCLAFSIIISVVSLGAVALRGTGILDIDFVGGASAEIVFKDRQTVGHVRTSLQKYNDDAKSKKADGVFPLNDISVQNVQISLNSKGENNTHAQDTHFIITTSMPSAKERGRVISSDEYLAEFSGVLKKVFGNTLVYHQVKYEISGAANEKTTVSMSLEPGMNMENLRSAINTAIKDALSENVHEFSYSLSDSQGNDVTDKAEVLTAWTITADAPQEMVDAVLKPYKERRNATPFFPTSTTVGGSVAKDTRTAGLFAILASLLCIVIYMWARFSRLVYGFAAAIGLVHVVWIVLGMIALSDWLAKPFAFLLVEEFKIGLPVVAAFLALIGYALNDTIILFDRIRENRGKNPVLTGKMINNAINQTLSRTVLTAGTTALTALVLYFLGGQGLHTFAFAMSFGILFGTYSTIGIAAPCLYWMAAVDDGDDSLTFDKK